MIVMTYTGIMLFIAPPGRIANWANWELLGLEKEQYASLHTTFMILFLLATILHIYYNWKPITSYLKNKTKEMIIFTKDMVISVVLVMIFLLGTLYEMFPFASFVNFGEDIKESWEKQYSTAPYSHAELSSLKMFCKKVGFDLEESKQILKQNSIQFEENKSLSQIAKENGISPQFIYTLLKKNFEKSGTKVIQLTGLGKKKIKDVAISLQISTEELITKLNKLGIEASAEDKFRQKAEEYDKSPMDILSELGYKN
jgi:hypothetical protein